MDPEVVAQLEQQLRQMTDMLSEQNSLMANQMSAMRNATNTSNQATTATRNASNAANNLATNLGGVSRLSEQERMLRERQNVALSNLTAGLQAGAGAIKSFVEATLDGTGKFSDYNKSLSGLGTAALGIGAAFGPLGAAVGAVTKGATTAAQVFGNQTDNLLKYSDTVSKLGAVNSFAANELGLMANKAGVASWEIDKLIKPLQSMGSNVKLLGNTTAGGIAAFGEMTAISKEARSEFRRLGYSQEELLEAQAKYVNTMSNAGIVLTEYSKTQGGLAKASLEYQRNLTIMSDLTGQSVEKQQSEQAAIASTVAFQVFVSKLDEKIKNATGSDKERLLNMRSSVLNEVQSTGLTRGKDVQAALMDIIVSGQTSNGKALQQMGMAGDLNQIFRLGRTLRREDLSTEERQRIVAQNQDSSARNMDRLIRNRSNELILAPGFAEVSGLNPETMQNINRLKNYGAMERLTDTSGKIRDNQRGIGAVAEDIAQQKRDQLAEFQIAGKTVSDTMLREMNPLLNGFKDSTVAALALAAAAIAASAALGRMAVGGLLGKFGGKLPPGIGGGLSRMLGGSMLGRAAGLAGKAFLPASLAVAGYGAYKGWNADESASTTEKASNALSSALNISTFGLLGKSSDEIQEHSGSKAVITPEGKKEGGSRSWRNNNPGNLEYGNFAKKYGAIGSDGRFAIFPTYEMGRRAKEALLFETAGYRNRTIAGAISRYAPSMENDTGGYISQVASSIGVSPNTPLRELNSSQRYAMLDAMQRVEGFKPGKIIPKAERGGIISGPNEGYPAILHGTEMVIPIDNNYTRTGLKDKIIEKQDTRAMIDRIVEEQSLLKSNNSLEPVRQMSSQFTNNVNAILKTHQNMISSLDEKLDEMIELLSEGNSTRTKVLQASRT